LGWATQEGYTTADNIALGVGLGLGLPSLLATIWLVILKVKGTRNKRSARYLKSHNREDHNREAHNREAFHDFS
jgi:hypothetical protein